MDPIARLNETLSARYEVVREIGAGGMATVYLARDLKHDRNVALKVLKPELGAVLGVERFLAEIKVTANLQHPNLLPLFDSGETDGLLFYVMPFVEGETLRAKLDREKQLPIDESVRIAVAVASALDYAHKAGVVHRDLKPENILLQSGLPVIADFGIALAVSKAGGQRITESGLSLGTPQYMSPEQATADRVIDGRSDIYSLGAVMYEMLTGEPPHTGTTAQAIISRIINEEPRPLHASRTSVPAHVEYAIHTALAKLPADRFSDAARFAAALQGERSALGTAASGAVRQRSRGRLSLPWAAVAMVGLAAAFAVGKFLARTPTLRVVRFALTTPESQAFIGGAATPVQFTPDGKAIVYIGRGGGSSQIGMLYYRRLDELEGKPLPGTEDASIPTISPSGDWVAFARGGGISKVSLHGGAPIPVSACPCTGISWGANDEIFAGSRFGLYRVAAAGGTPQLLAPVDTARHEAGYFMPMALPDGKNVLVWSRIPPTGNQPGVEQLAMVSISDGKVTTLDGDALNAIGVSGGYVLFGRSDNTLGVARFDPNRTNSLRDVIPVLDAPLTNPFGGVRASLSARGDLVYVRATDSQRLVRLDAQGRDMESGADERNFRHPRISPDGRQVVVAQTTDMARHSDLWVHDVASGVLQRLTTGGNASAPEWTRDGRRVVYLLVPEKGPQEAWWVPADRSGPGERLVAIPGRSVVGAVLSADARYAIIQLEDPKTKLDIFLVDLKGDKTPTPLEHSAFNETQPAISPDGHWLVYVSDESGLNQVYVRPFPTNGARVQVSASSGDNPRWASDSRSIVYRRGDGFEKAQLAIGASMTVTRRDSLFSGVYGDYDFGSNGTIWVLRPGSNDAEVIVVLNWIAELKAKVEQK